MGRGIGIVTVLLIGASTLGCEVDGELDDEFEDDLELRAMEDVVIAEDDGTKGGPPKDDGLEIEDIEDILMSPGNYTCTSCTRLVTRSSNSIELYVDLGENHGFDQLRFELIGATRPMASLSVVDDGTYYRNVVAVRSSSIPEEAYVATYGYKAGREVQVLDRY